MTKQIIFTGTVGNDKTGDKLRIAFTKVNENFNELYANVAALDATAIQRVDLKTNAAFDKANSAYIVAVNAYNYANNIISENTNLTDVFTVANAAFDAANNVVIPDISTVSILANAAFDAANNAVTDFSPAFNKANDAYDLANGAYNYANTIISENTNLTDVFTVANSAFDKANSISVPDISTVSVIANDAFDVANSAFNYANTIISENTNLTDVFTVANAAFDAANNFTVPSMNLNSLSDVSVDYGAISAGYVLKWDGSKWAGGVDATSGGGGADADTLDGQHGSYYLDYRNFANTPNLSLYLTTANASNTYATHNDLYVYANAVGVSANNYAGEMANASNAYASSLTPDLTAANNYAGAMANSVNSYTSATYSTITQLSDNWSAQNNSFIVANAAYDKANSANVLAYNTGIGANAYASSVGTSANAYATAMDAASNAYANVIGASANAWANSVGVTDRNYSNTIGAASNNWANTLLTTAANATIGNVTVTYVFDSGNFTKLGGTEESFGTYSSVTGATTFDCTSNYIFYVTPSGNFHANLSNFTLDSNNVTSVTFVLNQGVTPYMSNNYMFIGSANLTINWQGGTAPTGTASKKDVLTLSILNVNGANTVLGQLVSFG